MSWSVSADPLRFTEAEQWFRNRVPLTKAEWDTLSEAAKQRAFTVSGVAQLDLVNDTWRSLQKALEEGQDFGEWKKAIGGRLEAAWGKKSASRLETIFFQNVQSAYSAGRYKQLTDPDVIKARPYWLYDAVMDSRTTKLCSRLNGTVRPADDSWWDTHTPPLHFFCRSGLRSLTRKQAAPRITEKPPELAPPKGFGARPDLTAWQPDLSKYPVELWRSYLRKNGRNMSPEKLRSALTDYFAQNAREIGEVKVDGMTEAETMLEVVLEGLGWQYSNMTRDAAVRSIAQMLGTGPLPAELTRHTERLIFSAQRNRYDAHWARVYNIPGFTSAATGGDGNIVVYSGRDIGPHILAHEMGHNLAFGLWGETIPPSSSHFAEAVASGEAPPNEYASVSLAEDFAVSVEWYVTQPARLRRVAPRRYQAIRELIDGDTNG